MQEKNETIRDFLKRTDELALALGKNVQDLTRVLELSRASLFSYRTGKRPITSKAWRKLEQAEREAGLAAPVGEQMRSAKTVEEMQAVLESATRTELFNAMPVEIRRKLVAGELERMNSLVVGYILDADGLATVAQEFVKKPGDKQLSKDVVYFAKKVRERFRPVRDVWEQFYEEVKVSLT